MKTLAVLAASAVLLVEPNAFGALESADLRIRAA
jgi:hypothetical protein